MASIRHAADPTEITRAFCNNDLRDVAELRVLSIGKAGATMMRAAADALGPRLSAGLVVAPEATLGKSDDRDGSLRIGSTGIGSMPSDHPLPTARSVAAGNASLRFVAEGTEPLAVLLSGGGSAMVCVPAAGITLDDVRRVSDALMRAGATIDELNAVRKRLDLTKGGRLGLASIGRDVRVGVISDVVGDRLDVISSGPFAGDTTGFGDARAVLDRYGVRVPAVDALMTRGLAGEIEPTPGPGDLGLSQVSHRILTSNEAVAQRAAQVVREQLARERLDVPVRLETGCTGSAESWAERIVVRLQAGAGAVVLGGESTVSNVPDTGRGGPVQAVVLDTALRLARLSKPTAGWLVVGLATDGIDGPTDAAGAQMTPERVHLMAGTDAGVSADELLRACRSYDALDRAGALIRTGPSGTNVNDVVVAIRFPEP